MITYWHNPRCSKSRAGLALLEERGAEVHLLDAGEALDDAVAAALTGREGETVFVYGFADLVADAEAAVEAAGGDADAAKVENFG